MPALAPAALPPFAGFPKQGVPFFRALALAQTKEWFGAHKADYEKLWRTPMQSLLEELRTPLAKIYRHKLAAPRVLRINRDVRFTNDKSPYKTHCSGMIGFEGATGPQAGPKSTIALYLQLGLDEEAGCGNYELEPALLPHFRRQVLAEPGGSKLARLLDEARAHGHEPISMSPLKRAPAGVPKDHPRVEILRHKGLALSFGAIPKSVRYSAGLKEWLLEQAGHAAPVMRWSLEHRIGAGAADE